MPSHEQEFQEAILIVMERMRKKYRFGIYDGDDVAQEAYMIGLEVVKKYNPSHGPMLNYLSVSIHNRIKNFMRNTIIKEIDTCYISNLSEEFETIGNSKTTREEFWQMIEDNLSMDYRKDYLKLRGGLPLAKVVKNKLINEIRRIIDVSL